VTDLSNLIGVKSEETFLVSPSLPIALAGSVVSRNDPYLYVLVASQIQSALEVKGPNTTTAQIGLLQQAKVDLESWAARQNGFLWIVGEKLATSLNQARKLILPKATVQDDEVDQAMLVEMELKVRKSFLRTIFGSLGLIAFGGLAWLAQAAYLNFLYGKWPVALASGWGLTLLAFLGLLTAWLSVGALIFDKGVRELFALRHRRLEARRRLEHAHQQRAHLLQEILRIGEIYAQFQAWSKVLGPPLADPVNLGADAPESTKASRASGLPNSFAQGRLSADTSKLDGLAAKVREQYFAAGWLVRTVNDYLRSLGADLSKVWQESPSDAKSSMTRALEKLSSGQNSSIQSESSRVARGMAISSANYQNWPLETDHAQGKLVDSSADFMSELTQPSDTLPSTCLSDRAKVAGANAMDQNLSSTYIDSRLTLTLSSDSNVTRYLPFDSIEGRELDLMAVRLEVSKPLEVGDFEFLVSAPRASAKQPETWVTEDENRDEPEA
jgi:hypothetical protein